MISIKSIINRNNILFFLMGFFVFSSFDSTLCIDILHLSQLMPEVLIIPFLILLKDKRKSLTFDKSLFQKYLVISIFLLVLAIGVGQYQILGILSIYRSYLYMMIALCFFKNNNDITTDDIQWMMLGSLAGWFHDSRINFANMIIDLYGGNFTYGLLLVFPLFFSITLSKRRYVIAAIGLALCIGIFVFSGLRRIIAVFLISIAVIFALQFIGNMKRVFSILLVSFALIITFNVFSSQIEDYIMETSPRLYYRMYTRTEESVNGGNGSDEKRLSNFAQLCDQGIEILVPKGFYTNHTSESGAGVYNDFPLSAIIWTIGLPFTIILLGFTLTKFYKAFRYYKLTENQDVLPYIASFVIILAMMFLDGSFLSYTYCAPITGMCLGKILYYANPNNQ